MSGGVAASHIIGGNRADKRSAMDYYPTPPEVTLTLMKFLGLDKSTRIWEPACGDGRMVDVIRRLGYPVLGTDIQTGYDFLKEPPKPCDWIITNPPFTQSEQFILRAAEHGKPFAFLLKSQYWHAKSRLELFNKVRPAWVLPLTWRPNFRPQGPKKESPVMDFIWCVWLPEGISAQTRYIPLRKVEA